MKKQILIILKFTYVLFFVFASLQAVEEKIIGALSALSGQLQQLNFQLRKQTCQGKSFLSQLSLPPTICILDSKINKNAPTLDQLRNFAKETCIEVVQLVVAWQDLSVASFLMRADPINAKIEEVLGYTDNKIVDCMKKNAVNENLFELIKGHEISQKKLNKKFEFEEEFLQTSLGGGYASCGYHAVLHLSTLRDALSEPNIKKRHNILNRLTDLEYINEKFGKKDAIDILNPILLFPKSTILPSSWRKAIIRANDPIGGYANVDGEWLTGLGVMFLAADIKIPANTLGIFHTHRVVDGGTHEATDASAVKEEYESAQPRPNEFLYLINISDNHWYGIFLKFNTDPALCIIVDSKNIPRYSQLPLEEILKGLFSEQVPNIKYFIDENFNKQKAKSSTDREIYKLERLQAFARVEDLALVADVIREIKPTKKELEYIFSRYKAFEKIRNYFKNYDSFTGALELLRSGFNQDIPTSISELIKENRLTSLPW